jgi:hypothetical protein
VAHLDGALWTEVGRVGLDRPVLQLLAEHPEFALSGADAAEAGAASDAAAYDAEKSITFDGWRTVHRRARPAYTIQVRGATHVSFMDVPLLPLADRSPVKAMLATPRSNPGACGGSPATCSSLSSPTISTRPPPPRRC